MRKSYYAIPFLAAGAVAAGLMSASAAAAAPTTPIPTEYPWCELDVWCYDDDLQVVLNPRSKRDDVQYGGGAAFGN